MREIKFRAKIKNTGNWFYFDLKTSDTNFTEIDWNTICQFTGLKDKNGKEIYEGDIIRFVEDKEDWFNRIGYENGSFVRFFDDGTFTSINQESMSQAVIIGNIYENPDITN